MCNGPQVILYFADTNEQHDSQTLPIYDFSTVVTCLNIHLGIYTYYVKFVIL